MTAAEGETIRGVDIDLLRGLHRPPQGRHWLSVLACSLAIHAVLLLVAVRLPSFTALTAQPEPPRVAVHRTPLYLPPSLLTQRAPNNKKVSKSIDLQSLLSPPAVEQQRQRASRPRAQRAAAPPAPAPSAAPAKPKTQSPAILPDAPQMAVVKPPPPTSSTAPPQLPTPQLPKANEAQPKGAAGPFQNIDSGPPVNPNPTLRPKTGVEGAIQGLAQQREGKNMVISDENETQTMPAVPGTPGTGASPHTAVELQSDPQGADFRAYLTQILTIVRGNWRRVIPESARLGALRGRTTMEFIINRDGKIPKMVVASSSGSDPLDRAAAAGLSMSDPLPPLPDDYRGFQVRLAFTFSYNVPSR